MKDFLKNLWDAKMAFVRLLGAMVIISLAGAFGTDSLLEALSVALGATLVLYVLLVLITRYIFGKKF